MLLVHDGRVLLAKRSPRTHQGNTWSTPGGALQAGEAALTAAMRELREELGMALPDPPDVIGEDLNDHGRWSYRTYVVGVADPGSTPTTLQWETSQVGWLTPAQVDGLASRSVGGLHPEFARTWARLRVLV